jgi:parvulin-like peptidyl-prolyl isomerase
MPATFLRKLPLLGLVLAVPAFAFAPSGAPPEADKDKPAGGAGPRVQLSAPLFAPEFGSFPVARVGDDAITVRDFAQLLAETHADHTAASGKGQDYGPLLDRLIGMRLIVLEARTMGIDELPEVKKAITEFRTSAIRNMVRLRVTADVKPDADTVERVYRDAVRQWKVESVLFPSEDQAKAFVGLATSPAAFGEHSARFVKEGAARDRVAGQVFGRTQAQPAVIEAVEKLQPGQVSPPIRVSTGWAVLLLDDVLYPETPSARADAERSLIAPLRQKALMDHFRAATKKYAKIDDKLLKSLDYEAKRPGPAALAKDRRPLVRIAGEAPITVADLTKEMEIQFFHGMDQAVKDRKVNAKKVLFLEVMLNRRLLDREAKDLGIAESDEYKRAVAEYERSMLFGYFVERAVVPDIKVFETESRAYYDSHKSEFQYPELYKLETLAFARPAEAQAACTKLQSGTDVKWLKANADNQLDPSRRSIQIDGTSVTPESMPEALTKVLSGTKAGDCRIFARGDAEVYAVLVAGKTDRQVQPFEEARPNIDRKLFQEKVTASIAEWGSKLRGAYDVKVFITGLGV